jgi:hypothetical protein
MPDAKPAAVCLDSCIVIELFDKNSKNTADCRQIFDDAEKENLTFVISSLLHAEVAASSKKVQQWDVIEIRRALFRRAISSPLSSPFP